MLRILVLLTTLLATSVALAQETPATDDGTLSGEVMALLAEADALVTQTLYGQAAQLLSQAYDLTAAAPDSALARSVLNSLANLHYSTGQLELARRYYQELATLDEASGDDAALSVSLYNLGHAEASRQEFAASTAHFNRSLELSLALGDQSGAAYTLKAMGVNLHAQEELFSAVPLLDQSLALFDALGDTLQAAIVRRHLGDLEHDLGNAEAAIAHYEAALPVLAEHDYTEAILKCYRGLSLANEALGDLRRALVFQRAYTDLLQLELSQQNQEATQRLQVELETRRFADDNVRLQAIRERQQQELAANRRMLRLQALVLVLGAAMLAMVAFMLWRARHNARHMYQLANTDALTGLRNRRCVMEQGELEWQRAQRFDRPLCCLVFDVDHFKSINDTYGHAQGDQVLRTIAQVLQATVRPTDLIGRIGGEEFLLIASETSLGQAKVLAERLRQAVARIILPGLRNRRITISIGVAERHGAATLEQAIHQADEALYEAKESGRNQVCTHGEPPLALTGTA